MKRVIILADAAEDIEAARDFYEARELGAGEYCIDSLLAIRRGGRFNLSTIHEATARVLLRDISKILFPNNP